MPEQLSLRAPEERGSDGRLPCCYGDEPEPLSTRELAADRRRDRNESDSTEESAPTGRSNVLESRFSTRYLVDDVATEDANRISGPEDIARRHPWLRENCENSTQ